MAFLAMLTIIIASLLQLACCQQYCKNQGHAFRDECFWISDQRVQWVDADQVCHIHNGARLVAITDQEMNDFLTSKIHQDVWIGLHDTHEESNWKWSDDSPVSYTNFIEGHANLSEAMENNCVALQSSDGKWKDSKCADSKGIICALPRIPPHCPDGGTWFRDRCYWYGGANTWSNANEDCAKFGDGVKLVVVQDAELNAFLARLIYPGIWLGLHDRGKEGKWEWVNGSPLEEISYQNWSVGKPQNTTTSHDCAVLDSLRYVFGQWTDQLCDVVYNRYVCAQQPCYEGDNGGSGDGDDEVMGGKDESDNCLEVGAERRCISCVTGSRCRKGDNKCLCEEQFTGMACDKEDITVTIYAPDQFEVGSNVTLRCHVNLPSTDVMVLWQKAIDTEISSKDTKTDIEVYPERGDYELTIKNLQSEDMGSYVCGASTILGEVSVLNMDTYLLEIAAPSVPSIGESTSDNKDRMDVVNQGVILGILIGMGALCVGCVLTVIVIKVKANRVHRSLASECQCNECDGKSDMGTVNSQTSNFVL